MKHALVSFFLVFIVVVISPRRASAQDACFIEGFPSRLCCAGTAHCLGHCVEISTCEYAGEDTRHVVKVAASVAATRTTHIIPKAEPANANLRRSGN